MFRVFRTGWGPHYGNCSVTDQELPSPQASPPPPPLHPHKYSPAFPGCRWSLCRSFLILPLSHIEWTPPRCGCETPAARWKMMSLCWYPSPQGSDHSPACWQTSYHHSANQGKELGKAAKIKHICCTNIGANSCHPIDLDTTSCVTSCLTVKIYWYTITIHVHNFGSRSILIHVLQVVLK